LVAVGVGIVVAVDIGDRIVREQAVVVAQAPGADHFPGRALHRVDDHPIQLLCFVGYRIVLVGGLVVAGVIGAGAVVEDDLVAGQGRAVVGVAAVGAVR